MNFDAALICDEIGEATMIQAYDREPHRNRLDRDGRSQVIQAGNRENMRIPHHGQGLIARKPSMPVTTILDSESRRQGLPGLIAWAIAKYFDAVIEAFWQKGRGAKQ